MSLSTFEYKNRMVTCSRGQEAKIKRLIDGNSSGTLTARPSRAPTEEAARPSGDVADERGNQQGQGATKSFVSWLVKSREALKAWENSPSPRDNPPVSTADLRERQRQAVLDGGDGRIIESLTLDEPKSMIVLEAERRLFESVLGKPYRAGA